ncbi:hypothetical protein KFK09_024960 [Dendrobium nobile]|uniref:Uncharacterized protein n=1 Tax=Dendrobium nobile TaxID=94219 RepID=A0A8T3AEM2_DENNO|nr:hypothetical protein KFK09_024960 [Dendrobium nobile]
MSANFTGWLKNGRDFSFSQEIRSDQVIQMTQVQKKPSLHTKAFTAFSLLALLRLSLSLSPSFPKLKLYYCEQRYNGLYSVAEEDVRTEIEDLAWVSRCCTAALIFVCNQNLKQISTLEMEPGQ